MIYSLIFTLFSIISIIDYSKINEKSKWRFVISIFFCLFLILFWGLRWKTGTDWESYLSFYNSTYKNLNNPRNFETGYLYLNYIFRNLNCHYSCFLLFQSLLIVLMTSKALMLQVRHYIFALVIWFALQPIFPVRMSLALPFLSFAYFFLCQRKTRNFVFFVILASLFHRSALVALPLVFLVYKKIPSWLMLLSMGGCIVLGYFSESILDLLLRVTNIFGKDSIIAYKLLRYTRESDSNFSFIQAIISHISKASFFVLFLYNRERINSSMYNVYLSIYWVGLCLNRLFFYSFVELNRIGNIFEISEVILFALILEKSKGRNKLLFAMLLSVYFYFRYRASLMSFYDLFVPYYSVFDSNISRILY